MTKILIGSDIGGSHITCMAVDSDGHSISDVFKIRKEVDSGASADLILAGWAEALSQLISLIGKENLGGIGFAMPGPFDYPGGIAWFKGVKKYDNLYGINVRKEIRDRLELDASVPVRFLNDATSFAIGEAWTGRSSGFRKSMAITLGTGFGSAFIEDGIPMESGPEVPESGCVYHLPFGGGIADDHFSTRWFVGRCKALTGKEIAGVKELAEMDAGCGIWDTGSENLHLVSSIFSEFGTNMGNFLAPWLLKFGAGCLVIGGNIANSYSLFEKPFRLALEQHGCIIPVYISELGELAGIAGAARLCDDTYYSRLPFISGK
ncbi:MAG: ROK family protein [Bacteroidetes bacterium]|nr:ROK family protein [Bacteroidota bacterium]